MDESRIEEPLRPHDGTAPDGPEAERSLGTILAGDVNTVIVTTAAAVAGAYAVQKVLGREPDAKASKDDGDQATETDPPA